MKMLNLKKVFFSTVIIAQVALFAVKLLFGAKGISYMLSEKRKIDDLNRLIESEKKDIGHINDKISEWKTGSFLKEKYARQKLYMSKSSDKIYLIS